MTKTPASATTLRTPSKGPAAPHAASEYDANPSGIVVGLTVSMSWQLALVVLLPIVGGHVLDSHFHPKSLPYFTLSGLVLAIIGMIAVVRQTLKELNKYMNKAEGDKHDQ